MAAIRRDLYGKRFHVKLPSLNEAEGEAGGGGGFGKCAHLKRQQEVSPGNAYSLEPGQRVLVKQRPGKECEACFLVRTEAKKDISAPWSCLDLDLELLFSCYYCSKIYRSSSNRFPPTSAVPIFANLSEYWDHLARGHGGDLVGLAQFSEEDQKFDLLYDWIIKTERNEQQKEDVRPEGTSLTVTLSTPPTRKIINLSSDDSGKVSIVPTRKKQKKKKRRKTKAVENAVPNKHHGDNAPPAGTYSELLSRIEDLETAKRFMEIEIAEQESISDNLKLWLEMEQEEHNLTKEKLKIALSSSPTTNVQEEEELESPKFAKRRRKI